MPAGRVERGEEPFYAACRELWEETGSMVALSVVYHMGHPYCVMSRGTFHCYFAFVPEEFRPRLNWENDDWGWFRRDALPRPVHPGTARILASL